MNILAFLGGWQAKLIVVIIILASLFTYHKIEVNKAVTKATTELKLEYAQQVFRQIEIAKDESIKLKLEKEKADAVYKKNLAAANAKYKSLSDWVSNLPKYPSGKDNPGDSRDAEVGSEDVVGRLTRENAKNLAEYGYTTETLRQSLLMCYAQYDSVKESLDKLRLQDTSKTH